MACRMGVGVGEAAYATIAPGITIIYYFIMSIMTITITTTLLQ